MLYTTKKLLHEHGASRPVYYKFFHAVGREIADDELIGLDEICRVNGIADALWCLRATTEPCQRFARELACDFVEQVLPIFEREHPGNDLPRNTIDVARRFARGEETTEELRAAADAAWGAADAYAAAYATTYAAAYAGAGDDAADAADEREWQTTHFLAALGAAPARSTAPPYRTGLSPR